MVVLQDHYEPVATLAAIERERVTDLFLVEPLAERAVALLPAPHRAGQAEPTRPSAR